MDTIGDRLRVARETANKRVGREFKITQSELADMMGLTQSSVFKIEMNKLKRGEIDVIKLMDAAKFLKASFMWLATGTGVMDQDDMQLLSDIEVQKGFPAYWPQDLPSKHRQPQFHMNVAPLLYERLSKNTFFTLVSDEGMSPDVSMGDFMLVDPGGSIRVGSFVLAYISGKRSPALRRIIENEDGGYLLKPNNPEFSTKPLERLDNLLGVVVETRSSKLAEVSYKSEMDGGLTLNVINFPQSD